MRRFRYNRNPLFALFLVSILSSTVIANDMPLETVVQMGHTETVTNVNFSPDGKFIVTGSVDNTAKLWDVQTGREIRTFRGHSNSVSSVCFSPDGKYIVSGSLDNTARLWDIETGEEIRKFCGHSGAVYSVEFSPDGELIATGSLDNTIRLWDMKTGVAIQSFGGVHRRFSLIRMFVPEGINSVCFSPDGKYIAAACKDQTAKLWEVKTGRNIHIFKTILRWHKYKAFLSVSFSPDGKFIVTGGEDNFAWLWDVTTGKKIRKFKGHSQVVFSVDFSPDGSYILTGSPDSTARLWDINTGKEIITFRGHSNMISCARFSPDGSYILTGSSDKSAKLWDAVTGREIRSFKGYSSGVYSVSIGNKCNYIAIGGFDHSAKLWDITFGRIIRCFSGHTGSLRSIEISPNGEYLATGSFDNTAKLWDLKSGGEIRTFTGHRGTIGSISFTPDGKSLITGSWDRTAKLWNLETGTVYRSFNGHIGSIADVNISPDGENLVTGSYDHTAKLWDVETGREIRTFKGHLAAVSSVAFSPDGKYIVIGKDTEQYGSINTATLWDVKTGEKIQTFKGHFRSIQSISYSPDGRYIATGGEDNTVRIWDATTGNKIYKLMGDPTGIISSVNYDSDGQFLVVGSTGGTTKLWDVGSGKELATLLSIGKSDYAIVTPEGYYTTSKGALKGVHFVKGLNFYTFENFDMIFNRPDVVLERLGKAGHDIIKSYKKAYLKRLKKMGFTEDQISTDMHMPEVEFVNEDLPFETTNREISMRIIAKDSKYKLDRINVYVNDVPIYGIKGISFRGEDIYEITRDLTIELSNGRNKVQISAHNEKGAESLKETLEIIYNGPQVQPDLYVAAIGVSDYIDDDYDLIYSSKDANDLVTLLETETDRFDHVKVLKILDKDAIKENILNVKDYLMRSKVDDKVILFIAGHGLLDDKLDYYFATTDIDFANPSERGLPYEEIEGLLDGIPARKKLLLMDTCHSGEVDKEETELIAAQDIYEGTLKTRSFRGMKAVEKSRLGLENSYELLRELFADLRRGTGAIVISSSSGVEFALESEKWENGVFTYAVLEGLKTKNADKDKSGDIRVSELRDYVIEKVSDLTNGKQTPTSRRENLEFDFIVY